METKDRDGMQGALHGGEKERTGMKNREERFLSIIVFSAKHIILPGLRPI